MISGRHTDSPLAGLLDRALLTGQREVTAVLRPERPVRTFPAGDVDAFLAEVQRACQVWGGGGQPIVPVTADGGLGAYAPLLSTEQFDVVHPLQGVALQMPARVESGRACEQPVLLIAASEEKERWPTVEVVELDAGDPWRLVYAACLGLWPSIPDSELLERNSLRADLTFEECFPVERVRIEGSFEDLLDRLTKRNRITPRQASSLMLSTGSQPDSRIGSVETVLPDRHATRRAAGPNLVVAATGGASSDAALLWNLRGAHGDGRVMPIGVPTQDLTPDVLRELQQPGRATMFGLRGGRIHLLSSTADLAELRSLAVGSGTAQIAAVADVLSFGPPPGRVSTHVTVFEAGRTRLTLVGDADRNVMRVVMGAGGSTTLTADVTIDGAPLPIDATMRGTRFGGRFQAAAAQVEVSLRRHGTAELWWPSSWTALEAVAASRGLSVAESEAGIAAVTLIRALGDIDNIALLAHQPLVDLLYRMAERQGMAWQKARMATFQRALLDAGANPDQVEKAAVAAGRDEPATAPSGDGRAVPFEDFRRALGSEHAAKHWIAFAERRHLLVRGAEVTCPECRARSWLPLAALPPPVACPGCGRLILLPYEPRHLAFTYRLGEPLRRVLDQDCLGHVLALRWLSRLLERSLVGAHPGVDFISPDGNRIGEADVLLVTCAGELVPVEVKRTGAGVDDRTIAQMDAVAAAVRAPWDAIAVTQPARDITGLRERERRLPGRPRFVLTNDQMYEAAVFWQLGDDPFAYQPRAAEDDQRRATRFQERLARSDPDAPWDPVASALLDAGPPARGEGGTAAPAPEREPFIARSAAGDRQEAAPGSAS